MSSPYRTRRSPNRLRGFEVDPGIVIVVAVFLVTGVFALVQYLTAPASPTDRLVAAGYAHPKLRTQTSDNAWTAGAWVGSCPVNFTSQGPAVGNMPDDRVLVVVTDNDGRGLGALWTQPGSEKVPPAYGILAALKQLKADQSLLCDPTKKPEYY